jgi:serine/threonine protein phosphatase PrpC
MGSYNEPRMGSGKIVKRSIVDDRLRAYGQTDQGCERTSNEDCFLIANAGSLAGYFVFDGMGGQPAGETAALISAETISKYLHETSLTEPLRVVVKAIEEAQRTLLLKTSDASLSGMGTTAVGVLVSETEVALGAVGDSRAYHIKVGSITQMTNDHTLVQQLVDAGKISPSDAMIHPQSHILTRCLGSELGFEVDARKFKLRQRESELEPTEWILLCSDGLYGLVSEEEMAALVTNFSAQDATTKLIDIARDRGGFDNITALVIPLRGSLEPVSELDVRDKGPRWQGELNEDPLLGVITEGQQVHARYSAITLKGHIWRVFLVAAISAICAVCSYIFFNMRWG